MRTIILLLAITSMLCIRTTSVVAQGGMGMLIETEKKINDLKKNAGSRSGGNNQSDLGSEIGEKLGQAAGEILGNLIFGSKESPSPAEIAAARERRAEAERLATERQAELDRQREIERQEEQRRFEERKQELGAALIGMAQEVTKPLELIGMEKGANTNTSLALIDINPASAKTPVTVSPGQWTMAPDQLARELSMSRTAYKLAMRQINNYGKNKSALEQEIANLTNRNNEQQVFDLEKKVAVSEYQQHLVNDFASPPIEIPLWMKEERIKRDNTLQNQFGLSEKDLTNLKQEVLDALKTGVPTLGLTGNLEWDDKVMRKEKLSGMAKIGQKMDNNNEETSIISKGEKVAISVIESAYIKKKNMAMESLSKIKEAINTNNRLLASKKAELEGLNVEYGRLQQVFQKYGKDELSKDEATIIRFGNECRAALNIKIEEQY